jgi:hypothetical protein
MLVIGNGESRKGIDIDSIPCIKVGCNAIFRDFNSIEHIICVDKRMVREAIDTSVNTRSLVYTRDDWIKQFKNKQIQIVPELPYIGSERADETFQWSSGPYAVLLAAKLCKGPTVRLIGFDLYSPTQTVNNVYKGTSNYDDANKRAVDPRYWIHQIGMVFKCYPKVSFVVHNDAFELPKAWNYTNVTVDKISSL